MPSHIFVEIDINAIPKSVFDNFPLEEGQEIIYEDSNEESYIYSVFLANEPELTLEQILHLDIVDGVLQYWMVLDDVYDDESEE